MMSGSWSLAWSPPFTANSNLRDSMAFATLLQLAEGEVRTRILTAVSLSIRYLPSSPGYHIAQIPILQRPIIQVNLHHESRK